MWLQTFAHELGHGVAGTVLGSGMFTIRVFLDGSGVTMHPTAVSNAREAIIAAAGLVGPAFASALFFACARRRTLSRVALVTLGVIFIACAVAAVDNVFGRCAAVGAWGLVLLALGLKLSPARAQVAAAFAGVDLGLSVFSRGDYLFTAVAHTAQGESPSDVALVANAAGGGFYLVGARRLARCRW